MIKRSFDKSTYLKLGQPDLNSKMYMKQGGKKIWGLVTSVSYYGFKGANKDSVLLGLIPFKQIKKKR